MKNKDVINLKINIGELLFDELIKIFEDTFCKLKGKELIQRMKEEKMLGRKTKYDMIFIEWLRNDYNSVLFANSAIEIFEKYKLDDKQQYLFLKKASMFGVSMSYQDKSLLTKNIVKYFDNKWLRDFYHGLQLQELANILSLGGNMKFYKYIKSLADYDEKTGYIAKNLAENMTLPNKVDYCKEVKNNKHINVFNEVYDDACVYEKWPTKIRSLVYGNDPFDIPNPIQYLNQTNLISLVKSIYVYGSGSDEETHERVKEFYDVITNRVSKGELILYDYQNTTLRNIKNESTPNLKLYQNAPYTNYVLEHFKDPPKNEDDLDVKVLKKLILYAPADERKVL
jgi:hypothetical protein